MKANDIAALMVTELNKANAKFPQFNSRHEGYAVIKEEVDELWDEIKKKHPDKQRMLEEAVQIGAMAMKFVQLFEGAEEDLSEIEAKCGVCRYTAMTNEEIRDYGGDPCETCRELSNWKAKEEVRC
ncbi:Hypothetical protein DPCES_1397 [Desulfitobacterium hafniense]|uniref:Uncharacterized protein n=2 Tax=Desulfitobacterium hafniense TaxID=49338 RepID=A0A098AXC2_DESHA|nr:hypothetical protein [Desulfitobacterium hafniense]CDX01284.1 Hypothetical protein DPCES_1397 [Desulfitobacterium hafniense]